MVVFPFTDVVQHSLWKYTDGTHPLRDEARAHKYGNEITKYYQELDKIVGELVGIAGKDCLIFIVSDHGAGPLHYVFNVNNWLADRGYVKTSRRTGLVFQALISSESLKKALRKFKILKYYYRMSDRVAGMRILSRVLPDPTRVLGKSALSGIDWSQSVAYGIGVGNAGFIYLNLEGREPCGSHPDRRAGRDLQPSMIVVLIEWKVYYSPKARAPREKRSKFGMLFL